MRTTRIAAALLLVFATLAGGSSVSLAQSDYPDWQSPLTIQNIWENYQSWKDYTDQLDNEGLLADPLPDTALLIDLVGESFAITVDYLQFMDEQPFPTGECAQEFWYNLYTIPQQYALAYASFYHNFTADVGLSTDPIHWIDRAVDETDYYTTQMSNRCLNKLDT